MRIDSLRTTHQSPTKGCVMMLVESSLSPTLLLTPGKVRKNTNPYASSVHSSPTATFRRQICNRG